MCQTIAVGGHGVCVLFAHVCQTHVKAVCIVVLYDSDGALITFPIRFRIYDKESGKRMPWQRGKTLEHKKKYLLAADMLEWALELGFPGCMETDNNSINLREMSMLW